MCEIELILELLLRTKFGCGPAPVKAIKAGETKIGYDTLYFFQEVNGDLLTCVNGKVSGRQIDALGETIYTFGQRFTSLIGSSYFVKCRLKP